jgi:signal transduction histidine kinase
MDATNAALAIEPLAVLDSLNKHIALLDPDGTILLVNRAWRQFSLANGASLAGSDPVGVNYLTLCDRSAIGSERSTAVAARAGIQGVLVGALPCFELEYPCHSDAEQRWFLMRVSPLVGAQAGAVVTHENITPRWQLEKQRAGLIAELLAANRELTDFAHVVSHDLKAPLRGISSLASWLLSDFSDKLGAEGREHLNLMSNRVSRLSGLIDAILAYSRAGRTYEERLPVSIDRLVHNTVDLLAPPAHVQVHVAEGLPPLKMEAVKIQQVFQNLLSNAIDFMDKQEGRVQVDCVREGPLWHFSVSDNGPGIEPRHHERIFQLFQTLASRDEKERTGVGLALVKKIVDLEGGSLWLESTVGVGSTFHFTLPAVDETEPHRPPPHPPEAPP